MTANSRLPDFLLGDMWAAVAAAAHGRASASRALVRTYGIDVFAAALTDYFDYADAQSRAGLAALPKGRFPIAERMDDGAVWKAAIEIDEAQFTVDLREATRAARPSVQHQPRRRAGRDAADLQDGHGARYGLQRRLVPSAAPADPAGVDLPCARARAARLLLGDPHPARRHAVARACAKPGRSAFPPAISRRSAAP